MPFNIDLHTHSYFSGDAVSSPKEMIAAARQRGMHGFALTDHNTCDGIHYLLEQGLMREDGLPVDEFLVLPGVEVTTAEGHLLCIGTCLPDLRGRPAAYVAEEVRARGGLAIPSHPYDRFRAGIRQTVLDVLCIDALEVFNAATTFRRFNEQAFNYATIKGLPMTAGSDAHHHGAIGTAYTIVNTSDFSLSGLLAQILKENTLNQTYLRRRDSIRKTLNNWLRLRRRRAHPPRPDPAVSIGINAES